VSANCALHREVGVIALTMTGIGSIIGSGWLFGAWRAAGLAGPDAIYAWLIGAAITFSIALTYAELGATFPEAGGTVRFGLYSHGALVGFLAAWANWISVVSVIPVEATASVQYMASWPWLWAQGLYQHGELTFSGLAVASLLVIVYFLLNFWSVKLFARANTAITLFKLVVPALTAFALIFAGFHTDNFHIGVNGGPHTANWAMLLTAVATSGIVFSFTGFQSPVNLAGDARKPGRDVPIAVIGSILICTVIYLLLQTAFLAAVPPEALVNGWGALDYSSPFAQLALVLNLNWLALLLYADAFVSPSGTGIIYTAATGRMIYAMERNGTLPKIFGFVHPVYGIPRPAMWFNLIVTFLFLFWFGGWTKGVAVTSVAVIIAYLIIPVSLVVLRRTAPDIKRPLRLPLPSWLAGIAFVFGTLLLYWARWPLTAQVILLMVVALPVWFYYEARGGWKHFRRQMNGAWWLVLYLPAIALLSWVGSDRFGGLNLIPFGWDLSAVAIAGLGFYVWGVHSGWRTRDLDAHLQARTAQ
jgi:amino acid transporter